MKKNCYLFIFIALTSCKKDQASIYDAFKEPYSTGSIQIQYKFLNNRGKMKDTVVSLTTRNTLDYNQPRTRTIRLERIHPDNPDEKIVILFARTDLNNLQLPYTFKSFDAAIAPYVQLVYDDLYAGSSPGWYFGSRYSASSADDNFTLTIQSRENNRLQGTFRGKLTATTGEVLDIKNGLFDILVVEL